MKPSVAVVLHDVAPHNAAACERLRRCVASVAPSLPLTLLVVPRFHGRLPEKPWLRGLDDALARGDELALHGYTHLDSGRPRGGIDTLRRRWYTAGEGEFAALDQCEAAYRLAAGRTWFERRGWPLHGFVAPAWLLGEGARAALDASGFDYTCSLSALIALPRAEADGASRAAVRLRSQSIVYSTRARWRRAASCAWNPLVAWQGRGRPLLRFELHPADADHAAVRASWMGLLEQALRTRAPLTLHAAARALRSDYSAVHASVRARACAAKPA